MEQIIQRNLEKWDKFVDKLEYKYRIRTQINPKERSLNKGDLDSFSDLSFESLVNWFQNNSSNIKTDKITIKNSKRKHKKKGNVKHSTKSAENDTDGILINSNDLMAYEQKEIDTDGILTNSNDLMEHEQEDIDTDGILTNSNDFPAYEQEEIDTDEILTNSKDLMEQEQEEIYTVEILINSKDLMEQEQEEILTNSKDLMEHELEEIDTDEISNTSIDLFEPEHEENDEDPIEFEQRLLRIRRILDKYENQDKIDFTKDEFMVIIYFIINDLENSICHSTFHRDEAMFLEDTEKYEKYNKIMKSDIKDLKRVFPRKMVRAIMSRIGTFIYNDRDKAVEEEVQKELGPLLKYREILPDNAVMAEVKKNIKFKYQSLALKYDKTTLLWHCLGVLRRVTF